MVVSVAGDVGGWGGGRCAGDRRDPGRDVDEGRQQATGRGKLKQGLKGWLSSCLAGVDDWGWLRPVVAGTRR